MTEKISDMKEHKRKKGKLTPGESARLAAKRFLNPEFDSVKEPKGLASGKTSKSGGFIGEEEGHEE